MSYLLGVSQSRDDLWDEKKNVIMSAGWRIAEQGSDIVDHTLPASPPTHPSKPTGSAKLAILFAYSRRNPVSKRPMNYPYVFLEQMTTIWSHRFLYLSIVVLSFNAISPLLVEKLSLIVIDYIKPVAIRVGYFAEGYRF